MQRWLMPSTCCLCVARPRVRLSHLTHLHHFTETETIARRHSRNITWALPLAMPSLPV